MKKLLLIIFLFMIPISLAVGTESYPSISGENQDYSNVGRGEFLLDENSEFIFEQFASGLEDSFATPVIADLDNNSILELVIVDQDNIRIFQNKELDIVSVFDFGVAPTEISNILLFDIDDDGFLEIIFVVNLGTAEFKIFNFSQSEGIQLQTEFNLVGATPIRPSIACRAANECILQIADDFSITPTLSEYELISFDSTGTTSAITPISQEAHSGVIALCSPRDNRIAVADYDGDGNTEYIMSFARRSNFDGNDITYILLWLNNLTLEQSGSEIESVSDLTFSCDAVPASFTSPIVTELLSSSQNQEAIIGAQTSNDGFRIFVFSGSDGSLAETYPEVILGIGTEGEGNIVSNVVFGNFIPESTGKKDVCVMGFDGSSAQQYELLCGTQSRGLFQFDHTVLPFDFSLLGFNITEDNKELHHLIHGVQYSDALTEAFGGGSGQDLEEVLTTYGVFRLFYGALESQNELQRIFDPSTTRGVNLAIDLEKFGQDDIISMTNTNIFYFDDKGTNGEGVIIDVEYIPCPVDTLIRINTTMQVTVRARDTNTFALGFDRILASTKVYFNDINQQNRSANRSTDQSTGEVSIQFTPRFSMNKTITNGLIRTTVTDTENPTVIDIEDQFFSVALNQGLTFEDGVSCTVAVEVFPTQVVSVLNISAAAAANEGLSNFFETSANQFSVAPIIVVLFLMLGWTIAVLTTKGDQNSSVITMNKVIFMLIGNAFIFIIGTIAGAVSFGILLVFVILGIFGIILWARRMFTSNSMG